MSDAEHRDALAALRRHGIDGAALVRALVEINDAPARTEAERLGHARATAVWFAQATLDYLLELAVGPRPLCDCGHPRAWHASFSPRSDGPALGRCSPPANRVRLTKAGGLAIERGEAGVLAAEAWEGARSGADRARAAIARGAARDGGCDCRAFSTAPTGTLREGLGARHLARSAPSALVLAPFCGQPVLGNETVTTDVERFGELQRDCHDCAVLALAAARAPPRGARGRFVRRGRGPEPEQETPPEP